MVVSLPVDVKWWQIPKQRGLEFIPVGRSSHLKYSWLERARLHP
jgi:hypothetical protein